ncbi:MAG TPA: NUDIX domain-containing protein [Thermomicrobiales bacterium]|nr:NUDIX domain-containing protein [Thermomicrobiales bacterium]
MPDIVSDIVDVYVFRRQNARVQFLLLQRKATVPLGNTWQSFHTQVQAHETTVVAARRAVRELAGLTVSEAYSADYINEFFDDTRDVVVLAPVLAVVVAAQAPVTLGRELKEAAWWDVNQAVARLPFSGQRWAIKHIAELMNAGYNESQLYRLQLPEDVAPPARPTANASGESLSDGAGSNGELLTKTSIDPDSNVEPELRDFFHDVDGDEVTEEIENSPSTPATYRTDVP